MGRLDNLLFANSEELGQNEIYHYTTVEALFHIISNKSLRLSSTRYLNDYKELKLLKELIEIENLKADKIEYNEKRITELDNLITSNKENEAFIISFSKQRDLLSQWRGYADNSKGVSIGFNIENLRNHLYYKIIKTGQRTDPFYMQMQPVLYDKVQQYNKLSVNRIIKDRPGTQNILNSSDWINSIGCLFKHECFSEENEVRIIYTPTIIIENNQLIIKGPINELKYHIINGYLKPFFEIKFKEMNKIITSITIGANSKLTENELKRFLLTQNIDINQITIIRSNSSYKLH